MVIALNLCNLLSFVCKSKPSRAVRVKEEPAAALVLYELMRDRNKVRKARTRRLIQEGAILEKVFPSVASMSLDDVEDFLCGLRR